VNGGLGDVARGYLLQIRLDGIGCDPSIMERLQRFQISVRVIKLKDVVEKRVFAEEPLDVRGFPVGRSREVTHSAGPPWLQISCTEARRTLLDGLRLAVLAFGAANGNSTEQVFVSFRLIAFCIRLWAVKNDIRSAEGRNAETAD
jgi:hypothetical protein